MGDTRIVNGAQGPMSAALVDKENHLHVFSHATELGTIKGLQGENFATLAEIDTAATAVYDMAFIQNDSTDKYIMIERFLISSTGDLNTCEIWSGVSRTSGGTLVIPVNTNFSSANVLNATVYHAVTPGALVLGYTTAKEMYSLKPAARATTLIELKGRWVLGKNNTIGVKVASAAAAANQIRLVTVTFTWPVDAQL